MSERSRGTITKKHGSERLYVDFYYKDYRIVKSLGLKDTDANRKTAEEWLDNVIRKIDNGSFVFAEAFPGASEKEKTLFSNLEGWTYSANPQEVIFGDYAKKWREGMVKYKNAVLSSKRFFSESFGESTAKNVVSY